MECNIEIVMIIIITFAKTTFSSCVWDTNKDLPTNDPIYYKTDANGAKLLIPKSDKGLELRNNEIINLSCWGGKNEIERIGITKVKAKCIHNNKLLVNGRESDVRYLECASAVSATVFVSNRTCARGKGKIMQVGFNSPEDEWLELYHSCYDEENVSVIYSQHTLHGAALGGYYKGNNRKSFRLAGIQKQHTIPKAYTKKEQIKIFRTLLGQNNADKYINDKSFLARGHLAPDADFILNSWQQGTYLYYNTVPQWQTLNQRNWFKLENSIRKKARANKDDLLVLTGGIGVLSSENSENQKTEIYLLEDEKLPVPEFTFKIVYSESEQEGIGFFMLNDPFAKKLDRSFCKSICEKFGWWQAGWDEFDRGHIHCCDVGTMFSAIKIAPLFHASSVMRR